MLLMNSRRTLAVMRWTLAVTALAGIVLVYRRWVHVNPTTVALTLLLLILVLAAEWGLRYAVVISVLATALYNFYFLPPAGTFTIADPQNWLALFAFLSTAIIASRLSERAREEAAEARGRQRELEVLFRLSSELMQTDSVASLLMSIPSAVASVTSAKVGALYLLEGDRLYQAGAENGDGISEVEFPHLRHLSESLPSARINNDEIQIPIRSGARARGVFLLRGLTLSMATADAIGGLISVSIDRAQALESVARGEATKEGERLRTMMIDSVTHELRTPLTSIKGAATTLLQPNVLPEHAHELLTIIDEESDRLNQLVSEAVEMAQLDAQQVQLHFQPVDLRALIAVALHTCSWVEEKHTVHVVVPDGLRVRADENLLGKVLCNLLENAGKYSPEGTPITVTASRTGDEVMISVADRGEGIDPIEQGLVFERFYRGHAGQTGPGTGMGLAISRAIVEAHGGRILVTSQVGQGSVFTIVLATQP
jgi:two-component system sensor histidine kinase KdpD